MFVWFQFLFLLCFFFNSLLNFLSGNPFFYGFKSSILTVESARKCSFNGHWYWHDVRPCIFTRCYDSPASFKIWKNKRQLCKKRKVFSLTASGRERERERARESERERERKSVFLTSGDLPYDAKFLCHVTIRH